MPTLPKEVLEAGLKDRRFGITVRVALDSEVRETLRRLKAKSKRSFHDIYRVLLAIYEEEGSRFVPVFRPMKRYAILNVRLSRRNAAAALDWAWYEDVTRKEFLGTLAKVFFARVPFKYALKIFREQFDRAQRVKEEMKNARKRA